MGGRDGGKGEKRALEPLIVEMAGALFSLNDKEVYQLLKDKHPKFPYGVIFTNRSVIGGDTQIFSEQASRLLLTKPLTPAELKTMVREALKEMGK